MKGCRLVLVGLLTAMVLWAGPGWAQQPKPGGTLRVALAGDLTFFNANQGPAPGYFTFWVWNNIFNSLLTLTPPPELKIVPELAKSWDVLDEWQNLCVPSGRRGKVPRWYRLRCVRQRSGILIASSTRK